MAGQVVIVRLVCKANQTLGILGPFLQNRQPLHQTHVPLDNQPIHPMMGYVPYLEVYGPEVLQTKCLCTVTKLPWYTRIWKFHYFLTTSQQ